MIKEIVSEGNRVGKGTGMITEREWEGRRVGKGKGMITEREWEVRKKLNEFDVLNDEENLETKNGETKMTKIIYL